MIIESRILFQRTIQGRCNKVVGGFYEEVAGEERGWKRPLRLRNQNHQRYSLILR